MLVNLRAYHRPATLAEAVGLLHEGTAALLAGGTELLGLEDDQVEAVVDLSPLGLDAIRQEGNHLHIGAMVTLGRLAEAEAVAGLAGGILARAIRQSAPATIRAAATLGGTLAGAKGGEEVPTVLLALGARVTLATPDPVDLPLEVLLANRSDVMAGAIITEVTLPLQHSQGGFAFVSRTPADRAIVCAAVAGDRTAVGGVSREPRLLSDQTDFDAWPTATDHRAGAEYRRLVAPVLVRRARAQARGEGQA
ncbi:MAG TPA: FAD binding domain-containing protein [Symbiobacteriaceae bacterium]|nr:FAD binding domain-containing protein [Symbiobacteriaceae bacterium]